jgi:hypothetical protein
VNVSLTKSRKRDRLPANISDNGRQTLEKAGVHFGKFTDATNSFVHVLLPEGWKTVLSDLRSRYELLDENGFTRAVIFHKFICYNGDAFMNLLTRYTVSPDKEYEDSHSAIRLCVQDTRDKSVVKTFDPYLVSSPHDYILVKEQSVKEAEQWLDSHYEEWRDPLAYW